MSKEKIIIKDAIVEAVQVDVGGWYRFKIEFLHKDKEAAEILFEKIEKNLRNRQFSKITIEDQKK